MKVSNGCVLRAAPDDDVDSEHFRLTFADVDLLQAAETGSVPKIAKAVRLSQPAVHRQLARLEHRIGARLAIRVDDHLRLTDAGRTLLAVGLRFRAALAAAVHRAVDEPGGSRSDRWQALRIAVFGRNWDEFVDDVAERMPEVVLHLVSGTPDEGTELFEQHRVDAVYTWTVADRRSRYRRGGTAHDVLSEPMWVALPAGHRCSGDREVSLTELRADRWIVGAAETSRHLLAEVCAPHGFSPEISRVARSVAEARSLLWHDEGVALVSPLISVPAAGSGFVVRPLRDAPRRRHQLVVDPLVVSDTAAGLLCERLRQSYRRKAVRRNLPCLSAVALTPGGAGVLAGVEQGDPLSPPVVPAARSVHHGPVSQLRPEDLHLLRVIDASGSISRAAPLLLITQPALTRKVARLEQTLEVHLLRRRSDGTVLTPLARRILAAAAVVEGELDSALGQVRQRHALSGGCGKSEE